MSDNGDKPAIAIIGAGSIGVGWSIVLATARHPVCLYDISKDRLRGAREEIAQRLRDLASFDLLRDEIGVVAGRIRYETDLAAAVGGAAHIQECIPEVLGMKREMFARLDQMAPRNVALASSSSFLTASQFAGQLAGRERTMVVHPANPPFLLRVVEIVPAPFTRRDITESVRDLFAGAGMVPVTLNREVDGFAFNRLQGALLREAYCLVRDGVLSVSDLDLLVRDGLGLRWSVIGPFETSDLNTRGGIAAHAERMGPAYRKMGQERGQDDPWTAEIVADVTAQRRARMPLAQWDDRVVQRDRALMALLRCRKTDPAVSACLSEPLSSAVAVEE